MGGIDVGVIGDGVMVEIAACVSTAAVSSVSVGILAGVDITPPQDVNANVTRNNRPIVLLIIFILLPAMFRSLT